MSIVSKALSTPRFLTTVEELDSIPFNSVILLHLEFSRYPLIKSSNTMWTQSIPKLISSLDIIKNISRSEDRKIELLWINKLYEDF